MDVEHVDRFHRACFASPNQSTVSRAIGKTPPLTTDQDVYVSGSILKGVDREKTTDQKTYLAAGRTFVREGKPTWRISRRYLEILQRTGSSLTQNNRL
jgi:hypothetical protein